MKKQEAIEKLRDFCKLKAFCELYPDACQKDKCEIYMAIEALSEPSRQGQRDDLIKRQDAIDAFMAEHPDGKDSCRISWALNVINELPSAQPERKKGKWIYDSDCYICNQCRSAFGWWADSQTSNYCPNCGADMRLPIHPIEKGKQNG